jgi:RNA polymerase sigma-70 factor (sigma-E family)
VPGYSGVNDLSATVRTFVSWPKENRAVVHLWGVRVAEERAPMTDQRRALTVLYEEHIRRAITLARLLTGDDQVAEDVAQEAFVRSAGRFAHLRQPDAFPAYLRRTVVNLCRARFRRQRLERDWLRRQDRREPASHPSFDPDERAIVWGAIQSLPWRQRAAIVLRYYEDLQQSEIADLLGCSVRATESLLSRAITTLRSTMTEEDVR